MKEKIRLITVTAIALLIFFGAFGDVVQAQQSDTKGDPWMPWNDPDDPYVIRLNKDDPTAGDFWNTRNDKGNPKRDAGPIDLQRYNMGTKPSGFPTFFHMPIALTTEDLKAGDVDVAIVGATTDNNITRGTAQGANMIRVHQYSAGDTFYYARGGGRMKTERVGPVDQYTRYALNELRIVDYGNIGTHPFSADKGAEEIRKVIGEILKGGAMPMMVGGSHDSMYGAFMAMGDHFGPGKFGVLHLDSHCDSVKLGFGYWVHNGNAVYWGIENGIFKGEDIIQVGMTSSYPDDENLQWMHEKGIRFHFQAEIEKDGWDAVMKRVLKEVKDIPNLYVTVDIDVMASAYVPGTGGREVDGPTPAQVNQLLRAVAIQNNVAMMEISEYNPTLDSRSHQTALVCTGLMRSMLAGLGAKKKGIKDPFYYHPEQIDDGK